MLPFSPWHLGASKLYRPDKGLSANVRLACGNIEPTGISNSGGTYAAAAYGIFHFFDKKLSSRGKRTIARFIKSLSGDNVLA
jgi:hypothetical protein